jgi:hypothetical protein
MGMNKTNYQNSAKSLPVLQGNGNDALLCASRFDVTCVVQANYRRKGKQWACILIGYKNH